MGKKKCHMRLDLCWSTKGTMFPITSLSIQTQRQTSIHSKCLCLTYNYDDEQPLKGGRKKELWEKTEREAEREKCQLEKEVQVESERAKLQKTCMKHSNNGLMKGGQFVDDRGGARWEDAILSLLLTKWLITTASASAEPLRNWSLMDSSFAGWYLFCR